MSPEITSTKLYTLVIPHDGERVLLGMKKRGFGAGKWNGFGGKVEPGEAITDAALRELREECGITASSVTFRGQHTFQFVGDPVALEVHVFETRDWNGEPTESDEMRPDWFAKKDIPFSSMWPDDVHWFPHFFAERQFVGKWVLDGETIVDQNLEVL